MYLMNKHRLTPCQQPRSYGGCERYPDLVGLKGAQTGRYVSCESLGLNLKIAVDTGVLECG